MKEDRSLFEIFTGKHIKERLLELPRCRWENNITMDLKIHVNMRIGLICRRIGMYMLH